MYCRQSFLEYEFAMLHLVQWRLCFQVEIDLKETTVYFQKCRIHKILLSVFSRISMRQSHFARERWCRPNDITLGEPLLLGKIPIPKGVDIRLKISTRVKILTHRPVG